MLGTYQHSHLRIEVEATESAIRDSLTRASALRQWLSPQQLDLDNTQSDPLQVGQQFKSWLGPIAIQHHVDYLEPNCLRLLLSQGIDGFHEWQWGNGWIQSRLEGISLLPINLGQTIALVRLKLFLRTITASSTNA